MIGLLALQHVDAMDTLAMEPVDMEQIAMGEQLYALHCRACHHLEMRLVGPPLSGIGSRRDEQWLMSFIRSSQSMIAAGDSIAVALYEQYNKVPMPDQNLTSDEIHGIIAYLDYTAIEQPRDDGGILRPPMMAASSDIRPLKFSDYRFWIIYTVTVVLVIVAIFYKAELIALKKRVEGDFEQVM